MNKSYRWMAVLALSAVFLLSSVLISRPQNYMVNGDFFESWLAGRLLWQGADLYNPAEWGPLHGVYGNTLDHNPVFHSPPALALIFAPLGILPLPAAAVIWVFVSQWFVALSVVALFRSGGLSEDFKYLLPTLAGVFLFRPVMVMLHNGQNGGIYLLLLAAVYTLWQRRSWFRGGLLLAFLLLRPNIGLPIVGVIGLWLLFTRNWRAIAGILCGAACLAIASQLIAPSWLNAWMSVGDNKLFNTFGYHPSLWGLLGWLSGHNLPLVIWLGSLAVLILIAGLAFLFYKFGQRIGAALALSLAISLGLWIAPYVWAYDQSLLVFPVAVTVISLINRKAPYLIAATLHIFISIIALALLALALVVGEDTPGSLLTLLVAGLAYYTARPAKTSAVHLADRPLEAIPQNN